MKQISACLNTRLQDICLVSHKLEKIQEQVIALLPSHLKDDVSVGSFVNGQLLLFCKTQSWLTELNFLLPELRDNLRKKASLYQINGLRAKVLPDIEKNTPKKNNTIKLSDNSKQAILHTTEEMQPGPLKDALIKLAQN